MRKILMAAFAVLGMVLMSLLPATAIALNPGNVKWLVMSDGDAFVNYDFCSKQLSANNVEWPVTVFFYRNAYSENTIYNIAKGLKSVGSPSSVDGGDSYWQASTKYGALKSNGGSYVWDPTDGVKWYDCIHDDNEDDWEVHIRVYNGYYCSGFGYWCVATTHVEQYAYLDRNAQNPELGETYVRTAFKNGGYLVNADYAYFYNKLPGSKGSLSYYEGDDSNTYNNGYATYIRI